MGNSSSKNDDPTKRLAPPKPGQIDVSELFIRKRYQEMERLDAEYRKDLARYQYLKTGGRIGSPLTS